MKKFIASCRLAPERKGFLLIGKTEFEIRNGKITFSEAEKDSFERLKKCAPIHAWDFKEIEVSEGKETEKKIDVVEEKRKEHPEKATEIKMDHRTGQFMEVPKEKEESLEVGDENEIKKKKKGRRRSN